MGRRFRASIDRATWSGLRRTKMDAMHAGTASRQNANVRHMRGSFTMMGLAE
jgi:hypothetical protein